MKTRNAVLSAAIVVVVAAAGAAWWWFASLDGQVRRAIEHWGPEITGVVVRVDSVKIDAAEGRGTIRGLFVGNPKGFDAPHALMLGEMRLTFDPASITTDLVLIRELELVAPDVLYERGRSSDNLSVIQKNIDAWMEKHAAAKKPDQGTGKKFVIDKIIIRDGRAQLGTTLSASMPLLHLHELGKKSNGATAGEVVKLVSGATLRSVVNLASRAGPAIKEGWNKPLK